MMKHIWRVVACFVFRVYLIGTFILSVLSFFCFFFRFICCITKRLYNSINLIISTIRIIIILYRLISMSLNTIANGGYYFLHLIFFSLSIIIVCLIR